MNTAKKIDMLGSSRVRSALMMAFALAVMLCAVAVAPQAWAKTVSAPINVSDDITRIHVNKLNEDTHEHVIGAKMAIIEKATGTVSEASHQQPCVSSTVWLRPRERVIREQIVSASKRGRYVTLDLSASTGDFLGLRETPMRVM